MGLHYSKDRDLTIQSFSEQYIMNHDLSQISGSTYIGAKIYSNKHNPSDQILSLNKKYDDTDTEYNNELKKRFDLSHNNLLKLRLINQFQGACSTTGQLGLYFEWHDHSLAKELEFRAATQQYFTEGEIIFILIQMVEVLSYLQQNAIFHGDINPNYIHLTAQGQIKIGDQGIMNDTFSNRAYSKIFANPNHKSSFLAPEEMDQLSNRTTPAQTIFNQFKADAFALGMTLIYCCTLKSPFSCYVFGSENKIYNQQVDDLIDEAVSRYSVQLVNLIVNLLAYDIRFRPTFLDIKLTILPEFLKLYLENSANVLISSITVNINKSITEYFKKSTITQTTSVQQQQQSSSQQTVVVQPTLPLSGQIVTSNYVVQQPQVISQPQLIQTQYQPQQITSSLVVQPQVIQPQVVQQVVQQKPFVQVRGTVVQQPVRGTVVQQPVRGTVVQQPVRGTVVKQPVLGIVQPVLAQKPQVIQPQRVPEYQPLQPQQQPQQTFDLGVKPQQQQSNPYEDLDIRIKQALQKSSGLIEQANAQKF